MLKKRNLIFLSLLILGVFLLTGCWLISTPTYTVTFDSQGGSAVDQQTVERGGLVIEPTVPTRTGYAFAGWYKELECINARDFDTDTVTSDVTLYAQWNINSYTVTFDSQGGSAVASQTVEHGGKATEPTDPTMEGYTFGGWYKESGCTNVWNFDSDTVTSDVTLYAQWTINSYTVTYDGNGNTGGTVPVDSNDYEYGAEVTVLTNSGSLVRTGYTFDGWNTAADGNGTARAVGSKFNIGADDVTLYAKWNINSYTVTFDSQGGSAVASQTVEHGGKATEPTDPTMEGYTFGGWYKESGCTNVWNFDSDTVTSDVTLYAKWTANNYTITFNKNDDGAAGTMADQTIASGSSATLTACAFTKTGWTFAGWAETSTGTIAYVDKASYTMGTANVTLYAKWTAPETYSLRDIGPAGGLIFYDDEADGTDNIVGARYLEAAPADQDTKAWSDPIVAVGASAQGILIGTGETNTTAIIGQTGDTSSAALVCDSYSVTVGSDTYDDWFLPSKDELNKMWLNLYCGTDENNVVYTPVGGFGDSHYWSSSESNDVQAWWQFFSDGKQGYLYDKSYYLRVRAVRAF